MLKMLVHLGPLFLCDAKCRYRNHCHEKGRLCGASERHEIACDWQRGKGRALRFAQSAEQGMMIGYLRVSTQEQRPDRQIDGLKAICDELHVETLSAVSARRPVFEKVVKMLRSGDTLVVWDLDRAFRSTVDAVIQAERLRERNVEFRIVTLDVDTATPAGMLVYTVMAAFAEFERRNISKRTKEGLASARQRGRRLGRPPKLSRQQLRLARQYLEKPNVSVKQVAMSFGVAPWTLTRALKRDQTNTRRPDHS